MNMVSSSVVLEAKNKIEQVQHEISDNGQFQQSIATINEIIGTLASVWRTDGGQDSISKIGNTIQNLDNFSDLDSLISEIKSATVIYNHSSPQRIN